MPQAAPQARPNRVFAPHASRPSRTLAAAVAFALLTGAAVPARAEKADRLKSIVIASTNGGVIDNAKQRTEFMGDVVLTRGSLVLKAEKVAVKETSDGYYQAFASGEAGKPVNFNQARDLPGEAIEGRSDQLEFDTRTDTVRFVGNAVLRRTRGSLVTDEVTGAVIVYNSRTEITTIEGGATSPDPSGRARIVMLPRAAAAEPAEAPASAVPLRPTTTLATPRKPQ